MASVFENTVGGPQATPITAKATPVDTTSAQAITTASSVLSSAGRVLSQRAAATRVAEAKATANTVVGSFITQQLNVAEAVEQGTISSQEGRSRLRANLSSALANNSTLSKDLQTAHQGIVSAAGGARVVAQGTETEQEAVKLANEAKEAGWIPAGTPDVDVPRLTENYLANKRANAQLAEEQARVTLQSGKVGLSKSQLELQTATNVSRAQAALGAVADTYAVKFSQDINTVLKQWESGQIDAKQAIVAANNSYAVIQGVVNRVGQGAGATYVNSLVEPMTTEWNNFKQLVTGGIDKTIYENQLSNSKTRMQMGAIEKMSPTELAAYTASTLFKNADLTTLPIVSRQVLNMIVAAEGNEPVNPFPATTEGKQNKDAYYRVLKDNMRGSSAGTLLNQDASEGELNTQVGNVLDSVVVFGNSASSAEDMTDLVNFLASPEFGSYATGKGGVPAGAVPQARAVLQQQYEAVVLPLIEEEFNSVTEPLKTTKAGTFLESKTSAELSKVVQPRFSGAGVTFVSLDPTDIDSAAAARRLNSSISPVLNSIIRMSAHMGGNKNYESEYEKNYAPLFRSAVVDDTTQNEPKPTKPRITPVDGTDNPTEVANGNDSSTNNGA